MTGDVQGRREIVREFIAAHGKLTADAKRAIAAQFGCSICAVTWDLIALGRDPEVPIHVTKRMREYITLRDERVCQYCGGEGWIIEHVVPAAWNGPARAMNLVIACNSCNFRKGRSVWVPANIDLITENYPVWRDLVKGPNNNERETYQGLPEGVVPRGLNRPLFPTWPSA